MNNNVDNYYEYFGLPRTASQQDIEDVWSWMSGDPTIRQKQGYDSLRTAYEILSDPVRRVEYDRLLREQESQNKESNEPASAEAEDEILGLNRLDRYYSDGDYPDGFVDPELPQELEEARLAAALRQKDAWLAEGNRAEDWPAEQERRQEALKNRLFGSEGNAGTGSAFQIPSDYREFARPGEFRNLYRELGVSPNITDAELEAFWNDESRVDPKDNWEFERLLNAYATLRDAERRKAYDAELAQHPEAQEVHQEKERSIGRERMTLGAFVRRGLDKFRGKRREPDAEKTIENPATETQTEKVDKTSEEDKASAEVKEDVQTEADLGGLGLGGNGGSQPGGSTEADWWKGGNGPGTEPQEVTPDDEPIAAAEGEEGKTSGDAPPAEPQESPAEDAPGRMTRLRAGWAAKKAGWQERRNPIASMTDAQQREWRIAENKRMGDARVAEEDARAAKEENLRQFRINENERIRAKYGPADAPEVKTDTKAEDGIKEVTTEANLEGMGLGGSGNSNTEADAAKPGPKDEINSHPAEGLGLGNPLKGADEIAREREEKVSELDAREAELRRREEALARREADLDRMTDDADRLRAREVDEKRDREISAAREEAAWEREFRETEAKRAEKEVAQPRIGIKVAKSVVKENERRAKWGLRPMKNVDGVHIDTPARDTQVLVSAGENKG